MSELRSAKDLDPIIGKLMDKFTDSIEVAARLRTQLNIAYKLEPTVKSTAAVLFQIDETPMRATLIIEKERSDEPSESSGTGSRGAATDLGESGQDSSRG